MSARKPVHNHACISAQTPSAVVGRRMFHAAVDRRQYRAAIPTAHSSSPPHRDIRDTSHRTNAAIMQPHPSEDDPFALQEEEEVEGVHPCTRCGQPPSRVVVVAAAATIIAWVHRHPDQRWKWRFSLSRHPLLRSTND